VNRPTRVTAAKTADDADIYFHRGLNHERLGQDDQAISDYSKAVKLQPENETVYNNRGTIYYRQGKYDKAIKDFSRAVESNPSYALAFYNRGIAYYAKGALDRAVADFTRAIEIDPTERIAYNNRGRALLEKQRIKASIKDFNRALKLDADYTLAYYNRGDARRILGDSKGSIEDFSRAIKADPRCNLAYVQRGNLYLAKDDFNRAIKDYDEALRINPAHADVHNNRGFALFRKGEYAQALREVTKAIYLNPLLAGAYINRGLVYKSQGRYAKAIPDFVRSQELDPTAVEVCAYRAACNFKIGHLENALNDLKLAETIYHGEPQIPQQYIEVRIQSGQPNGHASSPIQVPDSGWNNPVTKGSKFGSAAEGEAAVQKFLTAWKSAWQQKDQNKFIGMYHADFRQGSMDHKAFLKSKKHFFRKYRTIRVETEGVEIEKSENRFLVKFIQSFQGDDYCDKGRKSMVLIRDKHKGFKIVQEDWSPAEPILANSGS
jgi:tetratricopeptide (TPR) repeat protein